MLLPKHIQSIVAKRYRVTRAELLGRRRLPHLVLSRHVAMLLTLEMVRGASLQQVGLWFNRHHTTVLAARGVHRKLAADRRFAKQVDDLRRLISKAG
jgi:chromosomal replication initiator protein